MIGFLKLCPIIDLIIPIQNNQTNMTVKQLLLSQSLGDTEDPTTALSLIKSPPLKILTSKCNISLEIQIYRLEG